MSLQFSSSPSIIFKNKPKQEVSEKVSKIIITPNNQDYLETLRQNGYQIEDILLQDHKPSYILASKDGIPFVINVDMEIQAKGLTQHKLDKLDCAEALLPHDIKIGALKCTESGICGAMFVNNGKVCVTKKKFGYPDDELRYTEDNFQVNGKTINSIAGLPLVNLSALLNDRDIQLKMNLASEKLSQVYRQRLYSIISDFSQTLHNLSKQKEGLENFIKIIYGPLKTNVESYETILPTVQDTVSYQETAKNLARLREIQFNALEKMGHLEQHYQQIANISGAISQEMDPVVAEVLSVVN